MPQIWRVHVATAVNGMIAKEFWLLCNADPEKDGTDGFFVAVFQRSAS